MNAGGEYWIDVDEGNLTIVVSLFFEHEPVVQHLRVPPNLCKNQVAQTVINGTSGPFYTYDYENRLIHVELDPYSSTPENVFYTYLPNGGRITRSNDTEAIYYLYDREDVIAFLDNSGDPTMTFFHGVGTDEPIALKMGTDIYYYAQDGLGSTVALINVADGTMAAAYRYDAWGGVHDYVGPMAQQNPYLFTGREYDWQTGIYYYRARSYDANLGRFLQRDPKGMVDGTNMYVYVGNDPVNNLDSSGQSTSSLAMKIGSCAIKFIIGYVIENTALLVCIGASAIISLTYCAITSIATLATGIFALVAIGTFISCVAGWFHIGVRLCEAGVNIAKYVNYLELGVCIFDAIYHEYFYTTYTTHEYYEPIHGIGIQNPKRPYGGIHL